MRRREAVLVSTAILAWTWGCESVDRPPLRAEAPDAAASDGRGDDETDVALPPSPETTESGPAVGGLDPGSMAEIQTPGAAAAAENCGLDAGVCIAGSDAGGGPACIPTGPRDCSSDLDNDCDGQPDNVVDAVCVCALGTSEACDEHPGLDGNGPCRAGLRTCVLAADGLTTEWGSCEGAVEPGGPDSCTTRGDDSDCDGTPNTDCPCVDGDTQECGSNTDTGPCQIGTSTCVNGRFGACVGAVPPAAQDSCAPGDDANCNGRANDRFCACLNGATQQCGVTDTGACALGTQTCVNGAFGPCIGARDPGARDCRSPQDNDCDGRPDNTIDNVCQCIPGQGNGPCSGNPNASRCNQQGRCAQCQTDNDCSLVSGGRNTCDDGVCVQPLLEDGSICVAATDCASGICSQWFQDADGDGFGATNVTRRTCGLVPPTGFEPNSVDCCDLSADIFPNQSRLFSVPQTACEDVDPFDYNCDGLIEKDPTVPALQNFVCASSCDAGGFATPDLGNGIDCGDQYLAARCVPVPDPQPGTALCFRQLQGSVIGRLGCR